MKSLRAKLLARATRWSNLALVVLGAASLALYRLGLRAHRTEDITWFVKLALIQSALYLFAAFIVWRARPARSTLIIAIIFAALFRLSILFAPPYLSDDLYRYIWDGRVQSARINPYRYVPADEHLASLRDETIYPEINRRDYAHTIYPPTAQMIFFFTTRLSERVTWMKAVMIGFEVLTVWALIQLLASFNLPRQRALIYAWHPLIVWEIAGSGHVDALMIAFVSLALLARRRHWETAAGVALACATLVKLYPVVLFPALCRRGGWRTPLAFAMTLIISYVPYLGVGARVLGFLPGYAEEEGIQNGARFYLLSLARLAFGEANVPQAAFIAFAFLALLVVALWSWWKRGETERRYLGCACALALTFTLLLSPRYPWYFAWLVPFMCLLPPSSLAPLFYLTTAGFILNLLWLDDKPRQVFIMDTYLYWLALIICAGALWVRHVNRSGARASSATADVLKQETI